MSAVVSSPTIQHEQTLLTILRFLPPNRVVQLVDFARFLEAQALAEQFAWQEEPVAVAADNAHWDALLATDEAQLLLDQLADEALAEQRAGKTKPMNFTREGRLVPG